MRVLFALPGLHRYDRGAEIAFISVATELAKTGDTVTLIGSGKERAGRPYRFLRAMSLPRENFESFPSVPVLRNECTYEELTFIPDFLRAYRPADYDITLTCGYPFINWALRRPVFRATRPRHIFVTQNGDWPASAGNSEYRFFGCEGLVCTNPDFYERNKAKWPCRLIPNGVDCALFQLGTAQRQEFGLPTDRLVVLMVSALIPSKRVETGIEAVGRLGDAHLVVAGDGPLRQKIDAYAARLLPSRFTRLSVTPDRMPALYQSANIFLHLSKEEAFGNVFLEATACGLPVVAHDTTRVRWIVGNDEFLLNTDDVAAIVRQIELARETGPVKRNERTKRAGGFSWERIAEMYRTFFHEVVDHPEPSSGGDQPQRPAQQSNVLYR
jgi:glycosyltransferase involved in cell wall biosynthesis